MPSEGNLASAWPGVRRVTLQTSDGLSLVAAFARADSPESSPTVLYFHGNGESAAQNLPFAKALSQAGVNVFLAEYRGHGGLDGRPTEAGLLRDADAAYASLSNLGIDPNLVILDEIRAHLASGRDQRG